MYQNYSTNFIAFAERIFSKSNISKKLNNKDLVANRKNLYIGTRKNHSPLGRSLFAPAVF